MQNSGRRGLELLTPFHDCLSRSIIYFFLFYAKAKLVQVVNCHVVTLQIFMLELINNSLYLYTILFTLKIMIKINIYMYSFSQCFYPKRPKKMRSTASN